MPIDVQFPGNLGQVDTIAKLRAVPTSAIDMETIYIALDVGRTYSFDFGSLLNDDGINVIRPNDRTPLQAGRFIYLVDGFAPGRPGGDGQPGATGSSDNTYTTLTALLASPGSRLSARLVPGPGETAPAGNFNYINGAWVRQEAEGVTYRLPATVAQLQTQGEKNAQTVDLWDALTPAMRADVRNGFASVDCAPAINAIAGFAYGAESGGDATGGTTLYIKGGRYRIASTLNLTYRRDNQIIDDGDLRRLNIVGDGSTNTILFYAGDQSNPAVRLEGYNSGTGRDSYQSISGLRIRRLPAGGPRLGIGLMLKHLNTVALNDVHVEGFDLGIDAEDVLGLYAERMFAIGNNVGMVAKLVDWTNPNVVAIRNSSFSGNAATGAQFYKAANVLIDTVRLEGIGSDQTSSYGLQFIDAPAEGGAWARVVNLYCENNLVAADVQFTNGGGQSGAIYIGSCSFQRTDVGRFQKYHIDLFSATAPITAVIEANGFRSFGAYAPSSSNPAWRNQSQVIDVTDRGNFYQNVAPGAADESPVRPALLQIEAASTITVTRPVVKITGNGTVNNITARAADVGREIKLLFTGTATLSDGTGNLALQGGFAATPGSGISLVCDGGTWIETGRGVN